MDTNQLVDALSDPWTYPHPVPDLTIVQTHISVVALAGPYAYKVKKPLDLGFLDFRTLDRRLHFCREEVRLNRRLAPTVYLGVVALRNGDGSLRIDEGCVGVGEGDVRVAGEGMRVGERGVRAGEMGSFPHAPVEYAVKMERLPDDATLLSRLERSALRRGDLERVARRVADFHDRARGGEDVVRFGTLEVVAGNARENFHQSRDHVGVTVTREVFDRVRDRTEALLSTLGERIEERARRGVPRDTHGDLHLEHVYLRSDREPPEDLVVIDCVEFSPRFRFADPVSDIAFLAMDLEFRDRRTLSKHLLDAYFGARDDPGGSHLVPFYVAYRAVVRAKVEGLAGVDPDRPDSDRQASVASARARWLLALGRLESPGRRPCLVLVGGLPGTGKSTLAARLAARADLEVVSSDRVRKKLAGLDGGGDAAAAFGEGIYTAAWNRRTYGACLERAAKAMQAGRRVIVDASFRAEEWREAFLRCASEHAVPSLFLLCEAEPEIVRRRLEARGAEGPSDADVEIYRRVAERWEEPSKSTRRSIRRVDTGGEIESSTELALRRLEDAGLVG